MKLYTPNLTSAASTVLLILSFTSLGACAVRSEHVGAQTAPSRLNHDKKREAHAGHILSVSPEWATQLEVDESVAGARFQSQLSDFSKTGNKELRALNLQLLEGVILTKHPETPYE